jgi:RNA polymerase sigma factor (sigma-70 family)
MSLENSTWTSFKNGDKSAMKSIYEDNVDMLFSYGKRLLEDDLLIYDHIHDVFVKLWELREKINEPASLKGYLVTMLRNHIIDRMRRNKTIHIDQSSTVFDGDEDSVETKIILNDEASIQSRQLDEAMKKLTNNQREIIYLKYHQEMSYEEIASIMNINYQSVRNLVHRAITELRKNMRIEYFYIVMSTFCI